MQPRTRAISVLMLVACGFTVISFHLIQIMLVQHRMFEALAIKNHALAVPILPHRGSILDADGDALAETQGLYDIRIDGQKMKAEHPQIALARIAEVLGAPAEQVEALYNPKNRYALIAHGADDAVVTKLKELKIESLIYESYDRRAYPNNELAAHAIGYVDEQNHGMEGVEKEMDKLLSGTPGERWVERDARHNEIAAYETREIPAVDGYDVTMTIHTNIQHIVEDELDKITQEYTPHAAYIIVMNPQTGEIMAMGSRPSFDPNDHKTFTPEGILNRCITDVVEPGSVFKTITLAAAINEHQVTLDTPIFCENGHFLYAGRVLHDDEEAGFGTLPVKEVLAQSSNIGFAKIALNYLHEEKLYKYATAFGIGSRTGLFTQQGESPGILRPLSKWSALSITRIPMGQEVGATPLQMIDAMCVVANGGKLMQPHLVSKVTDEDGRVVKSYDPKVIRQVITPETAEAVQEALHQVTIDGTAKAIKINGYSFGGKTGTAQKFVDGEYSHTKFVSSFLGFLPAQNPQFVALVMVDEPHTTHYYGAEVSAPVFADMARQIAQILNIPEDQPEQPAPAPVLSSYNQ